MNSPTAKGKPHGILCRECWCLLRESQSIWRPRRTFSWGTMVILTPSFCSDWRESQNETYNTILVNGECGLLSIWEPSPSSYPPTPPPTLGNRKMSLGLGFLHFQNCVRRHSGGIEWESTSGGHWVGKEWWEGEIRGWDPGIPGFSCRMREQNWAKGVTSDLGPPLLPHLPPKHILWSSGTSAGTPSVKSHLNPWGQCVFLSGRNTCGGVHHRRRRDIVPHSVTSSRLLLWITRQWGPSSWSPCTAEETRSVYPYRWFTENFMG